MEKLISRLGTYRIRGNEYVFKVCPSCGNEKWNMQVAIGKGVWHCWVCNGGGGVKALFRVFGIDSDSLSEIPEEVKEREVIELGSWDPVWLNGLLFKEYFGPKEIELEDLVKWGVRYKDNKLLFPFFEAGTLKYWVWRHMIDNYWHMPKGWNKKEVVFTKLVNPRDREIVLVEGVVDGIKVEKLGFNVLVLLGTELYGSCVAFLKLGGYTPIVCLDKDVREDKYEKLKLKLGSFKYVEVLVDDPSDMPSSQLFQAIKEAKVYGFAFRLKKRWYS